MKGFTTFVDAFASVGIVDKKKRLASIDAAIKNCEQRSNFFSDLYANTDDKSEKREAARNLNSLDKRIVELKQERLQYV
jgi:mevalonate pyrophosphate decarboxylase